MRTTLADDLGRIDAYLNKACGRKMPPWLAARSRREAREMIFVLEELCPGTIKAMQSALQEGKSRNRPGTWKEVGS